MEDYAVVGADDEHRLAISLMTGCIISSVPVYVTVRHLRLLCGVMLTIWWAASVHG